MKVSTAKTFILWPFFFIVAPYLLAIAGVVYVAMAIFSIIMGSVMVLVIIAAIGAYIASKKPSA